jgi:hypothetical protein
MGPWVQGALYEADDPNLPQHADMVSRQGALWVCILDHSSDNLNMPTLATGTLNGVDETPADWETYWQLMVAPGEADGGGFFDNFNLGDVFDWFKNASPLELLGALLGGAGILWAGSKIVGAMLGSNSGDGDGDAASTYDGSPGILIPTTPVVIDIEVEAHDNVSTTLPIGIPGQPIMIDGVLIQDGDLVLFSNLVGGEGPGVYRYDQATGTWTKVPTAPGAVIYVRKGTSAGMLFKQEGASTFVPAYQAPDIKVVCAGLCDYAGIPYDVSALPNAACEFVIGNNTSVRSMLDTLSLAYQFAMVDTNGTLKFIPRSAASVATLTEADLGYDSEGSIIPPYSATRQQGITLPRVVTLRYFSPDIDYNTYTQTSQLFTYDEGQDVTLDVPVTMTHENAKYVTEVSLVNAHLERQSYTFNVTYRFMLLEPGDVIETPMGLLRITRVIETGEGIFEITAVDAGGEISVAGSVLPVSVPAASTNIPVSIGYSQAFFIDPPNLNSADRLTRLYALVHGYGRPGWPGAQLYLSENGGASYDLMATTSTESTFGICETVMPPASYHVWDYTSTVQVRIKTGTLISVSEIDVLNGKNKAMIGQEMVGFKTATLIAPLTYNLSGFLRGRQGTEGFVTTHVADELFALLDSGLVTLPFEITDRGKTFKMKVVTIGSSLDKVDAEDVQVVSSNLYPWQVYGVTASKTGTDYSLAWNGRNRFNNELQDFVVSPNDHDWGGYAVMVYDVDNVTVKKSYPLTGQTFIYTGAMQTTDFGGLRGSCRFAICQFSTVVGAGFPVFVNV